MIKRDIERIVDANLNRLREALRVLEDFNRYLWDDKDIGSELKELRHQVSKAYKIDRLIYRDILNDVQKESTDSEMKRENIQNIITANFSRAEESSRVLEEVFKLKETQLSSLFKNIRYSLYNIEKDIYIKYFKNKQSQEDKTQRK